MKVLVEGIARVKITRYAPATDHLRAHLLKARAGFHSAETQKTGQVVEGLEIHPLEKMAEVIAATKAELAVLAVPAEAAQAVADAAPALLFAPL